jgi:recombination protein RecT
VNKPARQHQQAPAQRQGQAPAQNRQQQQGDHPVIDGLRGNAKWYADLLGADLETRDGQRQIKAFFGAAFKAHQRGGEKLWNANLASFFAAAADVASLGLAIDPTLQECFLIPRGGVVNFELGYRGILKMARRSQMLSSIKAVCVYARDEFEHLEGTDDRIVHRPCRDADPGEIVAAYAVAWTRGADRPTFRVLYLRDIEKARKAGSGSSPAWKNWYDEMALKTALKRLCKWLPVEDRLKAAIIHDDALEAGKDPGHIIVDERHAPTPPVQPARDLNALVGAPG